MLKTIPSCDLRPGMHIHKLLGAWMKHPFWRTSFIVNGEDIAKIHASGIAEVVIDIERGVDVAEDASPAEATADAVQAQASSTGSEPMASGGLSSAPAADRPSGPAILEGNGSFASEVVRARRICMESRDVVSAMFQDIRMGRVLDTQSAMPIVQDITASVMRNPSALISVARLKTADDYTYLHSVAVSAMMAALAGQLGLGEGEVLEAAMGGLLHDMGKARMPTDVLNKPGKLTDDEYQIMKGHPEAGRDLLRDGGVDNAAVLDIALHHHEKVDGTGYPHRLAGEDISLLSRMAAVCDVYDAVTSNRPYKAGWDPAESIHRMTSWKGHFDTRVLKAFIKSLGIYPVGALVRLESQKLGVVAEQGPDSLLKPRVLAFFSTRTNSHVNIHEVELWQAGCADRIVGIESPEKWGFRDLHKLWMP